MSLSAQEVPKILFDRYRVANKEIENYCVGTPDQSAVAPVSSNNVIWLSLLGKTNVTFLAIWIGKPVESSDPLAVGVPILTICGGVWPRQYREGKFKHAADVQISYGPSKSLILGGVRMRLGLSIANLIVDEAITLAYDVEPVEYWVPG